MTIQGAYCPVCREKGPDLILTPDHELLGLQGVGRITFTCDRCGARWCWSIAIQLDGRIIYSDPQLVIEDDRPTS
jgi:hypothetical protein